MSDAAYDRVLEGLYYAQGIVDAFAAGLLDRDYHPEDQTLRTLFRCEDAKIAMREAVEAIRVLLETNAQLRDDTTGEIGRLRDENRMLRDENRRLTARVAMYETIQGGSMEDRSREEQPEVVIHRRVCSCYIPDDGGRCMGTKEIDRVGCGGDELKCAYRNLFGTGNNSQGGLNDGSQG